MFYHPFISFYINFHGDFGDGSPSQPSPVQGVSLPCCHSPFRTMSRDPRAQRSARHIKFVLLPLFDVLEAYVENYPNRLCIYIYRLYIYILVCSWCFFPQPVMITEKQPGLSSCWAPPRSTASVAVASGTSSWPRLWALLQVWHLRFPWRIPSQHETHTKASLN